MNILFPLRSLGDFVIDAYIIKEKPGEVKFDTVLIPAYLKQLSVLIDATQVEPIEIDFNVKSNVLSLFTFKYLFTWHTCRELFSLRKTLSAKKEYLTGSFFLQEKDRRNWILSQMLRIKVVAPKENCQNVYYDRLLSYCGSQSFNLNNFNKEPLKKNSLVLIFPDSRLKRKELSEECLKEIMLILNKENLRFKIALFRTEKHPGYITDEHFASYNNFEELMGLVNKTDFILSSDSMPLHLANFLQKKHYCIYNNVVNKRWLTPWMIENKSYCVNNRTIDFKQFIKDQIFHTS